MLAEQVCASMKLGEENKTSFSFKLPGQCRPSLQQRVHPFFGRHPPFPSQHFGSYPTGVPNQEWIHTAVVEVSCNFWRARFITSILTTVSVLNLAGI